MHAPRGRLLGSAVLLSLFGCDDAPVAGQANPPELFSNASASIDEMAISATQVGDDFVLSFPLKRHGTGSMPVRLEASLVDITVEGEPSVGSASATLAQSAELESHQLTVQGAGAGLSRADAAGRVIRWSIGLPAGSLFGRTSLYAALGKLEVELRGATDVPAGGSVPWRLIVRDPDTLQAVAGAEVVAQLTTEADPTPLALFSGVTDAAGELLTELQLPAGVQQGDVRVEVLHAGANVWTTAAVRLVEDRKIYLSSDKTMYKPGQTVELRAVVLGGSERLPEVGETVTFEAEDAKRNTVWRRRVETDGFGVAAARLPTDARVNEGVWKVRALAAGSSYELSLPIERYVLPKLKVLIFLEQAYATPGSTVHGNLDAHYLFGEPVTGGDVRLDITTATGGYVTTVTGDTDDAGALAFSFMAPELSSHELESGDYQLVVTATVTDTAGQVQDGERRLPLVESPVVINALFEPPLAGSENLAYVVVTDAAGRPLVADLLVTGANLVAAPFVTDANGVAEVRFVPDGAATLMVSATDGAAREHSRAFDLAAPAGDQLLVRTDKAVYAQGDVAEVEIIAPASTPRIFLDVYQGGLGLESRAVELTDGHGIVALEITSAHGGLLLLEALALADAGTVLRGTRRLLVDRDDRLDIQISTDSDTYLPGGETQVSVQVTDAAGAPQVAALGLTAVNEAVFALGGEPKASLHTSMNLDPRLLPESVAIAGRSARDLFASTSATERERLAQLLFAAGAPPLSPGVEYNSVREELPAVKAKLTTKLQRDAAAIVARVGERLAAGFVDEDSLDAAVASKAAVTADAFARPYRAVTTPAHLLTLTSGGPDEAFDSSDDVSLELSYGYLLWGDRGDCANCDMDDGGFFPGAAEGGEMPNEDPALPPDSAAAPSHARSDFRETVYANPMLITDGSGHASVSFPLAHEITTWRLSAEGSTTSGKLGAARAEVRTFQSFFVDFTLPPRLTRGDEVTLSAIVYNYLPEAKTVSVSLEPAPWLTALGPTTQSLTLGPSEVRAFKLPVRVEQAGAQSLTLRGSADGHEDALTRTVDVTPDGKREAQSFSDKLNGQRTHAISIPADAIDGGTLVELVVTPGFASEAVEGTEGLLHEPGGCFEQTTSSAWPNTLVTTYLEDTQQLTPELRTEALNLVTRGYQRLLTFESPTGGYNWWGDNDAGNRILTAIMIWHLKDMERLIDIDLAVRDRALTWLLQQQASDGSWPDGDALHAGNEVLGTSKLRTTAFIAWALAHTGWADAAVESAAGYLRQNLPPAADVYASALVANALALADPAGSETAEVFAQLDELKETRDDGRVLWPSAAPTWTGTSGDAAAIETTGLVAYAMMRGETHSETAAAAMRFIIANKDSVGTWYNTQATMNALRALSAAASTQTSEAEGTLSVTVNGVLAGSVVVSLADGDLTQRLDLTPFMQSGDNQVELEMVGEGELSYRLTRQAFRPDSPSATSPLLDLAVAYDATESLIGEPITATVTATNNGAGMRDQVMVRLGRAPGFVPRSEDLAALVNAGLVSRYEVRDDDVTFYLMGLEAGEERELQLRLTPTLALEATAPASSIYAYYEPSIRSEVAPAVFSVLAP